MTRHLTVSCHSTFFSTCVFLFCIDIHWHTWECPAWPVHVWPFISVVWYYTSYNIK